MLKAVWEFIHVLISVILLIQDEGGGMMTRSYRRGGSSGYDTADGYSDGDDYSYQTQTRSSRSYESYESPQTVSGKTSLSLCDVFPLAVNSDCGLQHCVTIPTIIFCKIHNMSCTCSGERKFQEK